MSSSGSRQRPVRLDPHRHRVGIASSGSCVSMSRRNTTPVSPTSFDADARRCRSRRARRPAPTRRRASRCRSRRGVATGSSPTRSTHGRRATSRHRPCAAGSTPTRSDRRCPARRSRRSAGSTSSPAAYRSSSSARVPAITSLARCWPLIAIANPTKPALEIATTGDTPSRASDASDGDGEDRRRSPCGRASARRRRPADACGRRPDRCRPGGRAAPANSPRPAGHDGPPGAATMRIVARASHDAANATGRRTSASATDADQETMAFTLAALAGEPTSARGKSRRDIAHVASGQAPAQRLGTACTARECTRRLAPGRPTTIGGERHGRTREASRARPAATRMARVDRPARVGRPVPEGEDRHRGPDVVAARVRSGDVRPRRRGMGALRDPSVAAHRPTTAWSPRRAVLAWRRSRSSSGQGRRPTGRAARPCRSPASPSTPRSR